MKYYISSIIFFIILQISPSTYGGKYPCTPETSPLMSIESSWPELYIASVELPEECFDGYFAEGISDTLVRKMGIDWPGFLQVLKTHSENQKFIGLILRSINTTLNSEDVRTVDKLAKDACIEELREYCTAISKKTEKTLKEFELLEPGEN